MCSQEHDIKCKFSIKCSRGGLHPEIRRKLIEGTSTTTGREDFLVNDLFEVDKKSLKSRKVYSRLLSSKTNGFTQAFKVTDNAEPEEVSLKNLSAW